MTHVWIYYESLCLCGWLNFNIVFSWNNFLFLSWFSFLYAMNVIREHFTDFPLISTLYENLYILIERVQIYCGTFENNYFV